MEKNINAWPQAEKRKNRAELLADHVERISTAINAEMSQTYGIEDFLKSDGSINMKTYAERNAKDDNYELPFASCKAYVATKEIEWSGLHNPDRRAFYNAESDEDHLLAYKKERMNSKNKKLEMVAFSVLHKFLKDKFVVVHSSAYDDYRNGIDNILVNKETGDVICAFDEVHEFAGNSRYDEKLKKIKSEAQRGGKRLKYGFRIQDRQVVESEMRNLPVFLLNLKGPELDEAIKGISLQIDGDPNPAEQKVMRIFTKNLRTQFEFIKKSQPSRAIEQNLKIFENFLKNLEASFSENE